MKIRIKGNTVRYRLTKTEVDTLCLNGYIEERTYFSSSVFVYAIKSTPLPNIHIDFDEAKIQLLVSQQLLTNWNNNENIGFYESVKTIEGKTIEVKLEKDFVCLDDRGEDESDNYPNPKLNQSYNE